MAQPAFTHPDTKSTKKWRENLRRTQVTNNQYLEDENFFNYLLFFA